MFVYETYWLLIRLASGFSIAAAICSKGLLNVNKKIFISLHYILNNTSRMTGDCHVRFSEGLKGETPFDLLGVKKKETTFTQRPQR